MCKYECVVDDDCDSTEYCETDHSCQVGCRDDTGCPGHLITLLLPIKESFSAKFIIFRTIIQNKKIVGCATCESHVCSKPECCVDADCVDDDKPICEENICKAGCR